MERWNDGGAWYMDSTLEELKNYACVWLISICIINYDPTQADEALFKGDIKTDIFNSTYCLTSKEHFDTKIISISYSYQKL